MPFVKGANRSPWKKLRSAGTLGFVCVRVCPFSREPHLLGLKWKPNSALFWRQSHLPSTVCAESQTELPFATLVVKHMPTLFKPGAAKSAAFERGYHKGPLPLPDLHILADPRGGHSLGSGIPFMLHENHMKLWENEDPFEGSLKRAGNGNTQRAGQDFNILQQRLRRAIPWNCRSLRSHGCAFLRVDIFQGGLK